MALYQPHQVLMAFSDDCFSTIQGAWRPFIMMAIVMIELALVVWIHDGSEELPITSFPALAFSLISSGVLVYALHLLQVKRRTNYRVYLSSVPAELITLSAEKMDTVSRKEIADWLVAQKVTL
ncbi:hypothetical protein MNY66_16295 (plasmid) [Moellerella wisconsensis]|uniref:Uncharacterized protein n=1 Tax=Moellerella wisconsensis TaxID=158849 RepID=A0ACD3YBS8_9GAMM|nr:MULTISPECIES: hypothetical protein [Morganellaceae]UNH40603.1 hypothetical protein MNY70_17345 [Moellerella wisconsensis]UNH44307.1 hypothetical protein MNY66_16295 [Moellerella wisconsensis]